MSECSYPTEEAARRARRTLISQGAAVSLIAFDPARNLYVFDAL